MMREVVAGAGVLNVGEDDGVMYLRVFSFTRSSGKRWRGA